MEHAASTIIVAASLGILFELDMTTQTNKSILLKLHVPDLVLQIAHCHCTNEHVIVSLCVFHQDLLMLHDWGSNFTC